MSERIYKLQPNRTMALRGFDALGAAAALHSATDNSFKVSGIFRDPADFAVLILYDADNFYEHPRCKYLPNFTFNGLSLSFDVHYTGLMPLDSPKYETIDWPFLDFIRKDESTGTVRLSDHATPIAGTRTSASTSFTVIADDPKQFDYLTLWYLNLAYEYSVPKVECAFLIEAVAPGHAHTITVNSIPYTHVETTFDGNAGVAAGLVNALAACPDISASVGTNTIETGPMNQVNIRGRRTGDTGVTVVWKTQSHVVKGVTAQSIAENLAAKINATNWSVANSLFHLHAHVQGATIHIETVQPGVDGNMLNMYAVAKNSRLQTSAPTAAFTGGSSDVTWHVELNFHDLGMEEVRQMWFTYAPPLANGKAFEETEWQAVYTNWQVTGPENVRMLQVAGPGSVRIEETDSWCKFMGAWTDEYGFFSEGYSKHASATGATVTINYVCPREHDLYVGTSLYVDRAVVRARLDNVRQIDVDCKLADKQPVVNTRRALFERVPAGDHTLTIQLLNNGHFYFDFLEAAIPSDVPAPLPARTNISPALDYSTDHTYKLSPARLLWIFENLGYAGPMNEYLGVFWWNQRHRVGAVIPSATVTFSGAFVPNDQIFIDIGGQVCGKSVLDGDNRATVIRHFEYFINANYVGVWAKAEGDLLTITARSPRAAYAYETFTAAVVRAAGSTGAVTANGLLKNGKDGTWIVDPEQSPALNRGAAEWHRDFFAACAARHRELVVSGSMELVNPPEGFSALHPDGKPVKTAVGFGNDLHSSHCAFIEPVRKYHTAVFTDVAGWMSDAGLNPTIQCGEYVWWFFTNKDAANPEGGMAYYNPEIKDAARAVLGRELHKFESTTDDPHIHDSADALFLRNHLRDHVGAIMSAVRAAVPGTRFELLFPYDVNHPTQAGVNQLGGRLNRFVNLPVEWESKSTSGLDFFKTEALDFGAWCRSLDLSRTAIEFPLTLQWPRDSVRHLVPVFRYGYAWEKEIDIAIGAGVSVINLWAFDHVCIFGLPPTPEATGYSASF